MIRNTQWCYGVVIFAGKDTKLMQNSGKTKFKRTNIDRLLNFIIIGVSKLFVLLFLFTFIVNIVIFTTIRRKGHRAIWTIYKIVSDKSKKFLCLFWNFTCGQLSTYTRFLIHSTFSGHAGQQHCPISKNITKMKGICVW